MTTKRKSARSNEFATVVTKGLPSGQPRRRRSPPLTPEMATQKKHAEGRANGVLKVDWRIRSWLGSVKNGARSWVVLLTAGQLTRTIWRAGGARDRRREPLTAGNRWHRMPPLGF
jgi:hypothetical protein